MTVERVLTEEKKPEIIIWVDCETTGLDPFNDDILEIAFDVTGGDLLPLFTSFEIVINPSLPNRELAAQSRSKWISEHPLAINTWDPFVVRMHSESGLLAEIAENGVSMQVAKEKINDWFKRLKINTASDQFLMAGSTVGQFDRQFIIRKFPSVMDYFTYRVLDVSSVKEIVRRWYGEGAVFKSGLKKHRAMSDIEDSIRELRHYRATIFRTREYMWEERSDD